MNSFQLKVSFILFIVIFLWQYYSNIETTDIIAVIVKIDINVVMAMELDSISVSSPIFSAVISGRLPAGTASIRHTAKVASVLKPVKYMTATKMIGTIIIRITIYSHILIFLNDLKKLDLAMDTPSRVMDINTVALPTYSIVFEMMGGKVISNQNTKRLSMAIIVPMLNMARNGCLCPLGSASADRLV
jgi:hypothetical protein